MSILITIPRYSKQEVPSKKKKKRGNGKSLLYRIKTSTADIPAGHV
jgi:hypothetical protein